MELRRGLFLKVVENQSKFDRYEVIMRREDARLCKILGGKHT